MAGPDIQQEILDRLERIKDSKKRPAYLSAQDYQSFMPIKIERKEQDDSARYSILDQIGNEGEQATANAAENARLDKMRHQYEQMLRQKKRAQHMLQVAQNHQPTLHHGNGGGGGSGGGMFGGIGAGAPPGGNASGVNGGQGYTGTGHGTNGYGGYNGTPPSHVGVGKYLVTVHAAGHAFTVNRFVARRFVGFVKALVKRGYHPLSIGGYSNRNQANGSGMKSLHAYGLAIDIDPGRNPFTSGPAPHAIPNWAGSLAARYGLVWGGTWKHSKDYMHFSVPYGGRM